MACSTITKGIASECVSSMGGIKAIYLANFDDSNAAKISVSAEGGGYDAVSVTATNFHKFNTRKNVSSMTSTFNIDDANGVNYVSTELSLTFARMNAEKRMTINALRTGEMAAVVIDTNDQAWYLGIDQPITVTAGTAQTGAAIGDGNNYQVTITDQSVDLPLPLDNDSKELFKDLV